MITPVLLNGIRSHSANPHIYTMALENLPTEDERAEVVHRLRTTVATDPFPLSPQSGWLKGGPGEAERSAGRRERAAPKRVRATGRGTSTYLSANRPRTDRS